ncbi:transcriptional regulator domain-containing protein [Sandaracinobacteroides sayramensis]|uniref:transcriptional regulator domain-containing protein n=1 Tax=Sandaracinobacteroides sayramensis TaxID=2913411 RepID=UPI003AB9258C
MRPDTSSWRIHEGYDYFDGLPVEGLAWECLRRQEPYQAHYRRLVTAGAEAVALSTEAESRWGLRFRRATESLRHHAGCSLVSRHRPGDHHPHGRAGPSCRNCSTAV